MGARPTQASVTAAPASYVPGPMWREGCHVTRPPETLILQNYVVLLDVHMQQILPMPVLLYRWRRGTTCSPPVATGGAMAIQIFM